MGLATSFSTPAPNGTYMLSVVASNASGTSAPSNSVTIAVPGGLPAPPGPPVNLVVNVAGSTVTFNWSPPASGGPVAGYTLLAGTSPGFTAVLASVPLAAGATSLGVPGVPPGTYYARVVAQNAGGNSAPSNEVALTVVGATLPGAPTMHQPAVAGGAFTLSWTPGGGGSPTTYRLRVVSSPIGSFVVDGLTGTSFGRALAGVPSGSYLLSIAGVNAVGAGPESNQVTLVVP